MTPDSPTVRERVSYAAVLGRLESLKGRVSVIPKQEGT